MGVCLTKKQAEFFKVINEYKAKTGFYPGITEVAKILNKKPISIVSFYGSLFLRGAFTDGKPQTRYHAEAHVRTERRAQAQRAAARRPAAPAQPQQMGVAQKRRVAQALVKLLSGESEDQSVLLEIAHLMR